MKAKVIETGKIVDVMYWGSPSYVVFDCNSKIKEIKYNVMQRKNSVIRKKRK